MVEKKKREGKWAGLFDVFDVIIFVASLPIRLILTFFRSFL